MLVITARRGARAHYLALVRVADLNGELSPREVATSTQLIRAGFPLRETGVAIAA